ncbi:MAG: hypothetical protein J2P17_19890, partial [Mycobacterium sp.]|nr:hypothetical protein [Mycobacterium sp.]
EWRAYWPPDVQEQIVEDEVDELEDEVDEPEDGAGPAVDRGDDQPVEQAVAEGVTLDGDAPEEPADGQRGDQPGSVLEP